MELRNDRETYLKKLIASGIAKEGDATPMMRGACYDCRHRGTLAGSCHSRCVHPLLKNEYQDNPLAEIASTLGKRSGLAGMTVAVAAAETLGIKASSHGVAQGWFLFPFNFDPTWLEWCEGFEAMVEPKFEVPLTLSGSSGTMEPKAGDE